VPIVELSMTPLALLDKLDIEKELDELNHSLRSAKKDNVATAVQHCKSK
jgi:hypothetical protein